MYLVLFWLSAYTSLNFFRLKLVLETFFEVGKFVNALWFLPKSHFCVADSKGYLKGEIEMRDMEKRNHTSQDRNKGVEKVREMPDLSRQELDIVQL